jgi:hypothetical protein
MQGSLSTLPLHLTQVGMGEGVAIEPTPIDRLIDDGGIRRSRGGIVGLPGSAPGVVGLEDSIAGEGTGRLAGLREHPTRMVIGPGGFIPRAIRQRDQLSGFVVGVSRGCPGRDPLPQTAIRIVLIQASLFCSKIALVCATDSFYTVIL